MYATAVHVEHTRERRGRRVSQSAQEDMIRHTHVGGTAVVEIRLQFAMHIPLGNHIASKLVGSGRPTLRRQHGRRRVVEVYGACVQHCLLHRVAPHILRAVHLQQQCSLDLSWRVCGKLATAVLRPDLPMGCYCMYYSRSSVCSRVQTPVSDSVARTELCTADTNASNSCLRLLLSLV